jgi:hypothetical protein
VGAQKANRCQLGVVQTIDGPPFYCEVLAGNTVDLDEDGKKR